MTDPAAPAPIRDAATLILLRGGSPEPRVLMGQRTKGAAFMPNKFVFPGGALDPDDARMPAATPLDAACAARLSRPEPPASPLAAYPAAAIRETFEETGLALGRPAAASPAEADLGESWRAFAATGLAPDLAALRFMFRAITPPGQPRRFDARFFLGSAAALAGDPDDFTAASGELRHLTWAPLSEARALELPFITAVVLAEIQAILDAGWRPEDGVPPPARPAPFFRHDPDGSEFVSL